MKWSDQTVIDDYGEEIAELARETHAYNREDKIGCIISVLRKHKQIECIPTLNWSYLIKNIRWEVEDYGTESN